MKFYEPDTPLALRAGHVNELGGSGTHGRCEHVTFRADDTTARCENRSHSQICHCGKYHSLGRIHYGHAIKAVCEPHGAAEIARVRRSAARMNAPKLNIEKVEP